MLEFLGSMISNDVIIKNEVLNEGDVMHLYYSKMYGMYIAYGYSAFLAEKSLRLQQIEIEHTYSDRFQMPSVQVDRDSFYLLLKLCDGQKKTKDGRYYCIQSFVLFNEGEYDEWASLLRGEVSK